MSKIDEMLKYISEHNEFYKKIVDQYKITDPMDITQYPVLTRKQLQENRYNMFSNGYKSKYFSQQLRRQSSSGSSGIPVNVYWDYKDWYASNLSLWRKRLQWYSIHPNDKYVMFTLNAFNIKSDDKTVYHLITPKNIMSINVSLIQNNFGYENLIDIIDDFKPKWFYIQPFVLDKLIQAYKRTGKTPPCTLKYIESVGELLSSDLRRRAIDFFNVSLANMYGSEEMNGIAYECPNHHMHVINDNVYIEVETKEGIMKFGEGAAILTNLNNLTMPMIRYNQKDEIVIKESPNMCQFGCNDSQIEIIKGRTSEKIIFNDNIEINSFMLSELVAEVNNQFNDCISEYKFVYEKDDNVLFCYIKINEKELLWYENIKKALLKTFSLKLSEKVSVGFTVCELNQDKLKIEKKKILEIRE